jgi:hypothetical protein
MLFVAGPTLDNLLCSTLGRHSLQWIYILQSKPHGEQCNTGTHAICQSPLYAEGYIDLLYYSLALFVFCPFVLNFDKPMELCVDGCWHK